MKIGVLQIEPTTAVHMTDKELTLYREFVKHFDIFSEMIDANALDMKNGSVTLDFMDGYLMDIKQNKTVYKRMMRK